MAARLTKLKGLGLGCRAMPELTRDEAMVLLASLACMSDGAATEDEQALLRDRLAPSLRRMGVTGAGHAYDHLYDLLAERGPEWALDTISRALPSKADRVSALGLAYELIDVDGSVTREEMDHIDQVARTLGVSGKDLHPPRRAGSAQAAQPKKGKR